MGSDAALVLAIDTSAAHCAAAVVEGGRVRAAASEAMTRGQAERLFPLIGELLAKAGRSLADLDAIAVCTGPGNFTGVRIGVSAARGLALSLSRPAIGVTRLEALVEGAGRRAVALVAGPRGEVYAQAFDADGAEIGAPVSGPPETIAPLLAPARPDCALGASAETFAAMLGCRAGSPDDAPRPEAVARIAARRLGAPAPRPAPLYIRPADAAPSSDRPPTILP